MTYVSVVRLNDPEYEANQLLQHTYQLNNRVYRSLVIAAGVTYGAICQLMRYCWHAENFCSAGQRDDTIEVYEKYILLLPTLSDEALYGSLHSLKTIFGEAKAVDLQQLWDSDDKKRSIVFAQARDPEYRPYVEMFLAAAAEPTSRDIASRKRSFPEAACLKDAPIHNCKTENLFAHQSYAAQSTRAGANRIRGLAISKASSTFALQHKLRNNRRKRFLADVKKSKAKLDDWVEDHASDKGFLGLFNEKFLSVKRRRAIIAKALAGRRDNVTEFYSCTLYLWLLT